MSEDCEEVIKVTCEICGEDVEADKMGETEDGTEMCVDCLKDDGICFTCKDCEEIFCRDNHEATAIGDKVICEGCRDSDYFYCEDCNEWCDNDEQMEGRRGSVV